MNTEYPLQIVVDALNSYKLDNKPRASNEVLAMAMGLSVPTLINFMKGTKGSRKSTFDAVVLFLEKKGYLSVGMMPGIQTPPPIEPPKDIVDQMMDAMIKLNLQDATLQQYREPYGILITITNKAKSHE